MKYRVRISTLARLTLAGTLTALAIQIAADGFGTGLPSTLWKLVYNGLVIVSGVACAVARRTRGWVAVGSGLVLWAAGNLYWTFALVHREHPPYPSFADLLFLVAYVPLFAGTWLLLRRASFQVPLGVVVDALIAGLGAAALVTAVVLPRVVSGVGGGTLGATVNLLYPLADVALLALGITVTALYRRAIPRHWILLVAGFLAFAITDVTYLLQVAEGKYREGTLVDLGWPTAAVLIALAALDRRVESQRQADSPILEIALPSTFALTALGLLGYQHHAKLPLPSVILAAACVTAVTARMVFGVAALKRAAHHHSLDARTDALTGLGNRRALLEALEERLHAGTRTTLILLDLNGFKAYNDLFGHPSGDALLHRLAGKLLDALRASGSAYRMGGDEFCVLTSSPDAPSTISWRAARALSEDGDGFAISAACGHVVVPDEAGTASAALGLADQRMYANKRHGRLSPGEQSTHVLLAALEQRNERLGDHVDGVAELAAHVARELGLGPLAVEEIRTAAALHDIGKVAIPDSILHKPGPLDDEEWAFMHRHTIIGEKILRAAPSLHGVATLVRSSHERYDGNGYPDRLEGINIPLGARIILACDAFDAIVSDRPYSPARTTQEALDELRRNAGTQFDPDVVNAFARIIENRRAIDHLRADNPPAPEEAETHHTDVHSTRSR